jgi:hypothetical protein
MPNQIADAAVPDLLRGDSNASDASIAPRLTNTRHATPYRLDWPFARKPREKKPTACRPSEKSLFVWCGLRRSAERTAVLL